jgi:hypothetical protein
VNNLAFLGLVQQGRFRPLAAEHDLIGTFRLTSLPMQAAQPPESGELPLAEYEGSAIVVRGVDSGEWIYGAVVVEQAGLILTAVVQEVFKPKRSRKTPRLGYPLA